MAISKHIINVGTWAKYNRGILGQEIDAADWNNLEDFLQACRGLHADETDPEFMFVDCDGAPSGLVTESEVKEDFFNWLELSDDDKEKFSLLSDCLGEFYVKVSMVEDYCFMSGDNSHSIAEDYYSEQLERVAKIDPVFVQAIDWDYMVREMINNGWRFSNDGTLAVNIDR